MILITSKLIKNSTENGFANCF